MFYLLSFKEHIGICLIGITQKAPWILALCWYERGLFFEGLSIKIGHTHLCPQSHGVRADSPATHCGECDTKYRQNNALQLFSKEHF